MSRLLMLASLVFLVGCPDTEPEPTPDADVDAGLDADVDVDTEMDAEVEPEADVDVPPVEGDPPTCEESPLEMTEATPAHAHGVDAAIAPGGDGLAVVWIDGAGDDRDVVLTRLDLDLAVVGEPTVVAEARLFATEPTLVWSDDQWVVAWRDAAEDCLDEESCTRGLRLQRVAVDGTLEGDRLDGWPTAPILSRASLVATDVGVHVVALGRPDEAMRLLSGRADPSLAALTGPTILNGEQSWRQTAPAAIRFGGGVTILAEASPGGLVGMIIDEASDELTVGPVRVVETISASAPALAVRDDRLGLTYIDTAPTPPGNRVALLELDGTLEAEHDAAILVDADTWPKSPVIVDAGGGWVVSWHDGRNDDDEDCQNLGFCRDDVFLVAASAAGASGVPLRLSDDPNDCRTPTVARVGYTVATIWQTFRDARRTVFGRVVGCE